MSDNLSLIIILGAILYLIIKNKDTLKKLTVIQNIGVAISFLVIIGAGAAFTFMAGNWLAVNVENMIIRILLAVPIIIVLLSVTLAVYFAAINKITNGAFAKGRKEEK